MIDIVLCSIAATCVLTGIEISRMHDTQKKILKLLQAQANNPTLHAMNGRLERIETNLSRR